MCCCKVKRALFSLCCSRHGIPFCEWRADAPGSCASSISTISISSSSPVPSLTGLSVWRRFWLCKGWEGERKTWRGINHGENSPRIKLLKCTTNCILLTDPRPLSFLGANSTCVLWNGELRGSLLYYSTTDIASATLSPCSTPINGKNRFIDTLHVLQCMQIPEST